MKKQLGFFAPTRREHGGEINLGKRKTRRPLDSSKPVHVVLRSKKAVGKHALVNHQTKILRILRKFSKKFDVTIYETNINFNHIHVLIRGKDRKNTQNFFRSIAAMVARLVTGARKGKPFGKFWDKLIYTKLLTGWGREFRSVRDYIIQNTLETLGLVKYKSRVSKRKSNSSRSWTIGQVFANSI